MSNNVLFQFRARNIEVAEKIKAYYNSATQFNICCAGRRSLKTKTAKRRLRRRVLSCHDINSPFYIEEPANFFIVCPTLSQTMDIYWKEMLLLLKGFIKDVNKSNKTIELYNGATIYFRTGEAPERLEGIRWHGGILDEFGSMEETVWAEHLAECVADTRGYVDFIGVPEGRNHYYKLWMDAIDMPHLYGRHHWLSKDVLPDDIIEQYKQMLDEQTFRQEMEGSFENFQGRAYYNFNREESCGLFTYNPEKTIAVCFDFNTSPGVAGFVQQQTDGNDAVIDEVYVARNSNTELISKLAIEKLAQHKAAIELDGDATGGAHKSCSAKTDWEIVLERFRASFPNRVFARYPRDNPYVRDRINAVNSRLKNGRGERHLFIDAKKCPRTIEDFDAVSLNDKGELDKKTTRFTHLSDAIGYRISRMYPVIQYNTPTAKFWK